ncbi:MAG: hypothetical protein R2695_07920 [Acidimicrobiales bacterium]
MEGTPERRVGPVVDDHHLQEISGMGLRAERREEPIEVLLAAAGGDHD